ncbi:MAG: hypothetical protein ACFE9S_19725 [Candidatus Hermodarchaeota archaeon]
MRVKKNYFDIGLSIFLIAVSIGIPTLAFAQIIPSENINQDIVQGTGTIIYLSFEGGFYGISSDDGKGYDPINLPTEYEIDGLRVKFVGEILDLVSFHMWGQIIKILSIKLIVN